MELKNYGKILAVISGLFGGVLLNLILTGGIASWSFGVNVLDLVKAALLVVTVVGGAAWALHILFLRPAEENESHKS